MLAPFAQGPASAFMACPPSTASEQEVWNAQTTIARHANDLRRGLAGNRAENEVRCAIEVLDKDQSFGADLRRYRAYRNLTPRRRFESAALEELSEPDPPDSQVPIPIQFATRPSGKPCCAEPGTCRIYLDPDGRGAAIHYWLLVSGSANEVAKPVGKDAGVLDPRHWDDIPGSFFKEIRFLGPECQPAPFEPGPGGGFPNGPVWKGTILEEFEYAPPEVGESGKVLFRNVLHIDAHDLPSRSGFEILYRLCDEGSLGSRLPGVDRPSLGALERDDGFSRMQDIADDPAKRSALEACKVLTFSQEHLEDVVSLEDRLVPTLEVLAAETSIAVCRDLGEKAANLDCENSIVECMVERPTRAQFNLSCTNQ